MTSRKNLPRDGSNPTMLYGYGGFSISETPTYRPDVPALLEHGGIWVTANMRGGGEYGEAWHRAGMLEKKQNVFDDFIAVAEAVDQGEVHVAGEARDHAADRTADCWSAPSSCSGRICSPWRCRPSA